MPACLFVHSMRAGALGGQENVSEPLEQGLQTVVRVLMWMPRTEPRFSGKTSRLTIGKPIFCKLCHSLISVSHIADLFIVNLSNSRESSLARSKQR
jgi:hypothetical protein